MRRQRVMMLGLRRHRVLALGRALDDLRREILDRAVRMQRHRCRIGVRRRTVEDRRQNLRFEQGQDVEPLEGGLAKATIVEIVAIDVDSCS